MLVYTKSAFVAITKAILAEATARPEDGLRASFMTRECASAGGCTYSYGSTTSGVGNGRLKHNFANTHIYSGSINATTPACDEAGAQSSNLCCCLPASNADGGRHLCPQQEADCAGTDWAFDSATNRCLAIQEGCPAGTHGTLSQTSSADACVPCAAGKYGTVAGVADESGACSACEPGLYASTAGRTSCDACPAWLVVNRSAVDVSGGALRSHCPGAPPTGWVVAPRYGMSCDAVCAENARSGATCDVASYRIVSGDELNTALNAEATMRGSAHDGIAASRPCVFTTAQSPGLDQHGPLVTGNFAECETCPANGCIDSFAGDDVTKCSGKSYRDRRVCCCTHSADPTSSHMCALGATDCAVRGTGWNGAFCAPCAHGSSAAATPTATCALCAPGRFANETGLAATQCHPCPSGTFASEAGQVRCTKCSAARYAAGSGVRTSNAQCSACPPGRRGASSGLTSAAACDEAAIGAGCAPLLGSLAPGVAFANSTTSLLSAAALPDELRPTFGDQVELACADGSLPSVGASVVTCGANGAWTPDPKATRCVVACPALRGALHDGVAINSVVSLVTGLAVNSSAAAFGAGGVGNLTFGMQVQLRCVDGSVPDVGPAMTACGLAGKWVPDPIDGANPTQCTSKFCANTPIPSAGSARVQGGASAGAVLLDLVNKAAPMTVLFTCDPSARMMINGTEQPPSFALRATCAIAGDLKWNDARGAVINFAATKCQCGRGFKQGGGAKVAECVACKDGTYAPLNVGGTRAECRACPREGVSCSGGVLVILKDFWYDAESVGRPDAEGKLGVGSTTAMYKCAMRDACLVDTDVIPAVVRCHENHTGIMCARCYSRRSDCDRSGDGAPRGDCVEPGYFDRTAAWMYFALSASLPSFALRLLHIGRALRSRPPRRPAAAQTSCVGRSGRRLLRVRSLLASCTKHSLPTPCPASPRPAPALT